MEKKRKLLLKAEEHNWGLITRDDWTVVRFRIFYDGSYEIVTTYGRKIVESREEILELVNPPPAKAGGFNQQLKLAIAAEATHRL